MTSRSGTQKPLLLFLRWRLWVGKPGFGSVGCCAEGRGWGQRWVLLFRATGPGWELCGAVLAGVAVEGLPCWQGTADGSKKLGSLRSGLGARDRVCRLLPGTSPAGSSLQPQAAAESRTPKSYTKPALSASYSRFGLCW